MFKNFIRFLPLFIIIFSIISCSKESLLNSDPNHVDKSTIIEKQKNVISLLEAKDYFEKLLKESATKNSFNSSSDAGFISLIPDWDHAFSSESASGQQFIIAPLPDSLIKIGTQNRAGAKLLIHSPDSGQIKIQIALFIAEKNGFLIDHLNYQQFSGSILFFDINQNFEEGIFLVNGEPKGFISEVIVEKEGDSGTVSDDRTGDNPELYCETTWELWPCPDAIAFTSSNCYFMMHVTRCWTVGGGGSGDGGSDGSDGSDSGGGTNGGSGGGTNGGSGGGTNGGSGGGANGGSGSGTNGGSGNGTGSGSGNNSGGNPPPPPGLNSTPEQLDGIKCIWEPWNNYWCIFFLNVPVHIFQQSYSGELPNGMTLALTEKLIKINQALGLGGNSLTGQQIIQWLSSHHNVINHIYPLISGKDIDILSVPYYTSALILAQKLNLTDEEAIFLINNPGIAGGIEKFVTQFTDPSYPDPNVDLAAKSLIQHLAENNITEFNLESIADIGLQFPICPACFSRAFSIEYLILKNQNPGPSPIEGILDFAEMHDFYLATQAVWNVISSDVHNFLDIAGLIPVAGEVCDLTSALIYTIEGDNLNAAISLASALPIVGWSAGGVKIARKIVGASGRNSTLIYLVNSAGKIQFSGTVDAARAQLRRLLKTPVGEEAHHIVPLDRWDNDLVQKAADVLPEYGDAFHMNDIYNGVSLPISFHNGSHPNYTVIMQNRMKKVWDQLTMNNPGGVPPSIAKDKLGSAEKVKIEIQFYNNLFNSKLQG